MLSGDNGILQKATDAKTETEKGQEKEIVALAYNSALAKKISNGDSTDVTAGDMNTELTNQGALAGGNNPITVTFTVSKRQYTINSNGTIEYAGIQSEEETVAPTDVYATVCANGTLVFSNNEADITKYLTDNNTSLADGYSIENIKDEVYYWNSEDDYKFIAWDSNENITKVIFLNSIVPSNTANWFVGLSNLVTLENINNLNTSKVTDMNYMFYGCSSLTSLNLNSFDTSNVTDMNNMFSRCSDLTTLNLSGFDTSNVTDMTSMFYECSGLTSLNLSSFDTSNVTNMGSMFIRCENLASLDVSNFNTVKVTNMASMFEGLSNIKSLNLNNYNTANVTTMEGMFNGCSNLTTLNLSNFNTANVTTMNGMFSGCSNLTTLNLSNFNTANVTTMESMFNGCSNLTALDLSDFNTTNVTDMSSMFIVCSALQTIYVTNDFNTTNVSYSDNMFLDCSLLRGGNGTSYSSSHIDKTYANIDTTSKSGYFTAK